MTQRQTHETMVWDWWPLARLLITASVFGFASHHYLGWTPDLLELATLPRRVFEVLSFCALISFGLAHLYLILLMFPLYAVVTLNDTFYDASVRLSEILFGFRSRRSRAIAGLFGEIGLFGGCLYAIAQFVGRL